MGYCHCPLPDLWDTGQSRFCISCGLTASLETKPSPGREAEDAEFVGNDNDQMTPPSSSQATFNYKKLARASEFRLLSLSPGSHEDEITGEVFHSDISDPPDYEAVSYTWGDTTLTQEIRTEKGPIKITANCFSALKGLRHVTRERVLWVDAICIAQADDLEKNHQIPLMPKIYAKATLVLIYLGHDASLTKAKDLCALLRKGTKAPLKPIYDRQIVTFLSSPWFSRIWVLQEVVMASQAEVIFGSVTLNWRHLSIANIAAVGLTPKDLEGHIPAVLQFSGNDKKPVKDLRSLIELARSCLSSDPRDRIYALLGLVDERAGIDLAPDYTKTTKEVYTDVTNQFLKTYNCLHFLSDIESYDRSLPGSMAPMLKLSKLFDLKTHNFNYLRRSPLNALKSQLEDISSIPYRAVTRSNRMVYSDMFDLVLFYEPEIPHHHFHKLHSLTEELFLDLKNKGVDTMPTIVQNMLYALRDLPQEVAKRRSMGPVTQEWPCLPSDIEELWKSKLEICRSWESRLDALDTALVAFGMPRLGKPAGQGYERFRDSYDPLTSGPIGRESSKTINEKLQLPTWVPDYRHRPGLSSFAHWQPNAFAKELVGRLHTNPGDHLSPFLEVKGVMLDKIEGMCCPPITSIHLCGTEVLLTIGFQDRFTQSLMTMNHGADLSDIVQFSHGRSLALTAASLAIVPLGFGLGDVIAVLYGGTVPYLLRPSPSEPDRFQFIGECYLHGVRGPQFSRNYAGLLGWFKDRVIGQGEQDNLPWRTILLE